MRKQEWGELFFKRRQGRKTFLGSVNVSVYEMTTVQVQVRLPENLAKQVDSWVKEGKFVNRSDAIKAIVSFYSEREKTRKFYEMLEKRSKEARENPEKLVPIEKIL